MGWFSSYFDVAIWLFGNLNRENSFVLKIHGPPVLRKKKTKSGPNSALKFGGHASVVNLVITISIAILYSLLMLKPGQNCI